MTKEDALTLMDICERNGFGDTIAAVSALWRFSNKYRGYPIDECFVATIPDFIIKKKLPIVLNSSRIYDEEIERLLKEGT